MQPTEKLYSGMIGTETTIVTREITVAHPSSRDAGSIWHAVHDLSDGSRCGQRDPGAPSLRLVIGGV